MPNVPIQVVDIGATDTSSSGGAMEFFGPYPPGSLIVLSVYEKSTTGVPGTCSDLAGNTYNLLKFGSPNNDPSLGTTSTFYSYNSQAVDLATYTYNSSGVFGLGAAMYATGARTVSSPLDLIASSTLTTGNSTSPLNISSSLGDIGGELVIGAVGWSGSNTDTYTQASGFTNILVNKVSDSVACLVGGYAVKTGSTVPVRYNPGLSIARPWDAAISAFAPQDSPFSVFSLGSFSDTAGATVTATPINVPPGSLIFVAVFERNATGLRGTVTDSVGNPYIAINNTTPNGSSANGAVSIHYAYRSRNMTNATITFAKRTAGVATTMSIFYATGVLGTSAPLDGGVADGDFGTGFFPSINLAGNPSTSYQLIVAAVFFVAVGGSTLTIDFTNASWRPAVPTFIDAATGIGIDVAYVVTGAISNPSYEPSFNSNRPWGVFAASFKSGAFTQPPPDDQTISFS